MWTKSEKDFLSPSLFIVRSFSYRIFFVSAVQFGSYARSFSSVRFGSVGLVWFGSVRLCSANFYIFLFSLLSLCSLPRSLVRSFVRSFTYLLAALLCSALLCPALFCSVLLCFALFCSSLCTAAWRVQIVEKRAIERTNYVDNEILSPSWEIFIWSAVVIPIFIIIILVFIIGL